MRLLLRFHSDNECINKARSIEEERRVAISRAQSGAVPAHLLTVASVPAPAAAAPPAPAPTPAAAPAPAPAAKPAASTAKAATAPAATPKPVVAAPAAAEAAGSTEDAEGDDSGALDVWSTDEQVCM